MRVLITGVAGFSGRHLAELCTRYGAEVIGLGRRELSAEERPAGLDAYIAADLNDSGQAAEALRSAAPERVFHLAAEASVAASWADPSRIVLSNIRSAQNLLEAVRREAPDASVLAAGSGEIYGPVPPSKLPVSEAQELRPQNPYAVSKAAVDLLAGFYADAHGLAVVRTRAFNHAGPGQSDAYVVSTLARQVASAEAEARAAGRNGMATVVTGNSEVRRDFTDVRDVVRAYWSLLEAVERGVFNVCSGSSVSAAEILEKLQRLTPLSIQQRTDPARLRKSDVMELRGSREALTDATGWKPEIGFETTLDDTLRWWRRKLESQPGGGAERS